MAKLGRPRKNPKEPPEEPTDEVLNVSEAVEDIEYQEFLEEVGDRASSVSVHRYPKVGATMEWCDTVTADQATLENIRDKYGPGKYKLRFRSSTGNFVGVKNISIAAPAVPLAPATGPMVAAKDDDFLKQMLLTLLAAQRGPDLGAILQGMGNMMPKFDPSAMLGSMVGIFQALKPDSKNEDWIEKAKTIIELGKQMNPAPAGDDSVLGVVRDVGGKLVEAFSNRPRVAPAPQREAQPRLIASEVVEAVPPTGAIPTEDPEENMRQWLQQQINYLKAKARVNQDPIYWAEHIRDNDDEPGNRSIIIAMQQGATIEHLCAFDPEIESSPVLKAWFGSLYDALRDELSTPMDTGRPTRDTVDTGAHGAAGADSRSANTGPSGPASDGGNGQ